MVASSMSSRSLTVSPSSSILPRAVDAAVGNFLELLVFSIESVRERFSKLSR